MLDGYIDVPPGKVAAVVTYLEMRTPPTLSSAPPPPEFRVRRVVHPDLEWYRALYRAVGETWLWFSRLRLSDAELREVLHHPEVDVFVLSHDRQDVGLLEFDRRQFPDIELAFFGITPDWIGRGAGRALLYHCLPLAWELYPQRLWLHTCTSDHPGALRFYTQAGFVPYKRAIEVADDPRLSGQLLRSAAPHIPIV